MPVEQLLPQSNPATGRVSRFDAAILAPPASSGPAPDAPLTQLRRLALRCLHGALVAGLATLIVLFLVHQLWPVDESRSAEVTIVARSLVEIRVECDCRFDALKPLPNGAIVQRGQLLGHLYISDLEANIAARQRKLDTLMARKLLLDDRPFDDDAAAELEFQRAFRQIVLDIDETQTELSRLRQLQVRTSVVCPADGYIHFGLASRAAKAHETVAHIFPAGGELIVEVKAPLALINKLIERDRVEAAIPTAGGKVQVVARPDAATLRTMVRTAGAETQLWGVIQCQPQAMPSQVCKPGLSGQLQ